MNSLHITHSQSARRLLYGSVFKLFLFLTLICVAFTQTQLMVIADPLPESELRALDKWPNWVASSCGTASNSTVSGGSGSPEGASFPNLSPDSMATSIDKFIQQENPNSELKGLGPTIVASAKNSDVNPFLIVAIAHEESGLSDPGDYNVDRGNNSFGREATSSQPHFQGAHLWYKWSSVKASVDYNAPENQGVVGGGDIATYLRDQYGGAIDASNLLTLFMQYAPPSENNTTQYTDSVKGWISDMVNGSAQSPGPDASNLAGGGCACATAGAALSGSDNKEKIFNYFVGQGLTPAQAAGIDGNFGQESGWDPTDSGGYLAQWGGSRLSALVSYANKQGKPVTDLPTQLEYVWLELTNGPGAGEDDRTALQDLKATTTAADAATIFSNEYERPSDPQLQHRIDYANNILQKYGNNSVAKSSDSSCTGSVDCNNPTTSGLSGTRQDVVCIALAELALWEGDKIKPGFRANSADSFSKYSQNSDELWCADFASWVYKQAGDPLQAGDWRVPAVQTIQSIGQQNGDFHWHPAASYTPKPGDLVIHLEGQSHVNIVTAVSGSTMTVIGGDQVGPDFPDGSRVSKYTVTGFSNTDGITGYVSPD